jgi:hypothetical protein
VHTSRRVRIDADRDRDFAIDMVTANSRFYSRVEECGHTTVLVQYLDGSVQRLLLSLGLAAASTPVRQALDHLGRALDQHMLGGVAEISPKLS